MSIEGSRLLRDARGPILLVLGLFLAAAYLAGHYLAIRYAIEQETVFGTAGSQVMNATPDDGGLAEDAADVRRGGGERRGFLVVLVSVAVTCLGIILPRLKGSVRITAVVGSGVTWAFYPVAAYLTLGQWGSLMVGDGGNTGLHHDYAKWLPLMLLILVGAAGLQATGLVMQARRTLVTRYRESPAA
ncbi:hypothetical protein [Nonomuraea indica]|uniref:Uncharacterized protein n=1 Tax=Nonomuraea indica TaxID=1581193 RepID=A0ABW8AD08_9ACTN